MRGRDETFRELRVRLRGRLTELCNPAFIANQNEEIANAKAEIAAYEAQRSPENFWLDPNALDLTD